MAKSRGVNLLDIVPGANLAGVDLSGYSLDGLDLTEIDFSGANLTGASFYKADLTGAILVGANISDANFGYAILDGADLSGAIIDQWTTVGGGSFFNATMGADLLTKFKHEAEKELSSVTVARESNPRRRAHRRSNPNSMLQKASHVVFKAYYFAGPSSEDMVKVYEGFSETRAFDAIEKYEKRGLQVEIWQGVEGDSQTDQLYYP